MAVSENADRNANIFCNHDNSNSDMDVDTSIDKSHTTPSSNFSFHQFQTISGTDSQNKSVPLRPPSHTIASTPCMPSPIPPKLTKDENVEKFETLQNEIKRFTEDKENKNRRKSGSKSKDLSPREKRINGRKSETQGGVQKWVYMWFFVVILLALFIKFMMIHQKCHIHMDVDNFEKVFDENVFGQHIAKYALTTTLRNISKRMQNDTKISSNPLIFSFHGWTGVGKNFVTKQLVHGFENVRVTTFLAPLHFPQASQDDIYRENIQQWVKGNITLCCVNMFVFDEMDKATPGLLEGLLSVIKDIQTIEMQKTWIIFIFLSNSRGHQINHFLFTKMKEGRYRNDITYQEILPVLTEVQSTKDWYEDLNAHGFIDTFVPFLPLNKEHVYQCILRDILKKGKHPTEELIDLISEEMHYIQPIKDLDLFSLTGCKRVSDKVYLHV